MGSAPPIGGAGPRADDRGVGVVVNRGALTSGARGRGRRTPFVVRYRPLLRYPARQWPGLAVIAVVMAGAAVMAAAQPLPLKVLVDNGLNGAPLTGFPKTLFDEFGVAPTARHVVIAAA